ncbi:MAG: hypothetical protein AAFX08_08150 [Pseudomonadota bacterium]
MRRSTAFTRIIRFAAASAALFASVDLAAKEQSASDDAPPACAEDASPYRDFDFWIGVWDVALPDGTRAGENIITTVDGGCTLLEDWISANDGEGLSLSFVDAATGKWRQVWSSPGVTIDYSGGLDGAAMALEGTIAYAETRETFPFRGRWTPLDDGTVLQEFWQFNPESDEWDVWFAGVYTRRAGEDGASIGSTDEDLEG